MNRISRFLVENVKEKVGIIKSGGRNNYILDTLRKKGAIIGNKVQLYSTDIFIDPTRPWLLSIGSYTKITHHVIILTHDYSLSVLRRKYGEWIGEGRETIIGENCFIGMGTIILMGTKIGDNCIIGAGSVLRGEYPSDSVIVGNPARVVCSLEEYYSRRKRETIEDAKTCVNAFEEHMHRRPEPEEMGGFKFLFAPRDDDYLEREHLNFNCTADEPEEIREFFFKTEPHWSSFEDMIKEAELVRE